MLVNIKKITKVIYRKFKNNEVIALFPYVKWSTPWNNDIASYMHIGQHGAADYDYILTQTTLCIESEYNSLHKELCEIYGEQNLKIVKRIKNENNQNINENN